MSSTFSVRINQGPEQSLTTRTGVCQLAAIAAVAMLEFEHEADNVAVVEIWTDYSRFFFEVAEDVYGNLQSKHLPAGERRPDGSIIMKAYMGHGEFKWFERRDGDWKPLAMWQPSKA
ncbi:hypothetical protein CFBP5875_01295 [Agrobacterium pusense]|uniref:hypothetical protein n=1 Tax=Agrobacterium pusense TaxID=648995 RepID=UPI0010BE3ABE|nr:hypothetical protein [Agrobacterium pusense]QCL83327.1 hypothetical protein CFBP5875_01295 [Agrobacterium pusense]